MWIAASLSLRKSAASSSESGCASGAFCSTTCAEHSTRALRSDLQTRMPINNRSAGQMSSINCSEDRISLMALSVSAMCAREIESLDEAGVCCHGMPTH
eukprot:2704859-Rhodomonas_salina.2